MAGASISQSIQPTQRGLVLYSSSATVPTTVRNKTSCVILGRTTDNAGRVEAAAAGALVCIYLNVTTYVTTRAAGTSYVAQPGTYHSWYASTASGSPQLTPHAAGGNTGFSGERWAPYDYISGYITNTQIGNKLEATVRKIKAENPWCNGLFLDDTGPNWSGYTNNNNTNSTYLTSAQRESFYQAQVVLAQRYRQIADELGLFLITNGEWRGDTNYGYPTRSTYGCSLYDSFCIEHHVTSEIPFWTTVSSGQWRLRDPNGQRCMFNITLNSGDTAGWRNVTHQAWIAEQTTPNYTANPPNVNTSLTPHDLGLTYGSAPTVTVTVAPTTASVQTGTTRQFTATVSNGASVTWLAGGVVGGNSTYGTISGSGLYTAPVSVPTSGTVTVSATISTGENGSAVVTVTGTVIDPPPTEAPLPPNPAVQAFGNRFVGSNQSNLSAEINRTVAVVAPQTGSIQKLIGLVDGLATGATGQQPLRFTLYRDDGNGNPGVLAASTATFNVVANSSPTWASLALSTTVALNEVVHIGIHSGSTVAAGRYYWSTNTGVQRYVSDTFADGSVTPFGTGTVGNADISLWADYTPLGTVGATVAAASTGTSNTFGALTSATVVAQPQPLVVYLREPQIVVKQVPVPYAVLPDGSIGGRVNWNSSTQQFEPI